MAQIRNEIYDENGLIEVKYIEIEDKLSVDLLKEKENELLKIYEEIQQLKNGN